MQVYALLNCDDHANYLKKHKKDPALYRPDICHQALLAILDSPLCKAGKVKGIYIRTHKNVLISVSPKVRLPRTFKRFCGLMAQLLQKLSVRATNGPDKLLKVIKSPVTKYLPLECTRLGFSWAAEKKVAMHEMVPQLPDNKPVVFVVGAFAHGKIDAPWVDQEISISEYPLSAAYCLARITTSFEQKWKIV
ncbi:pre-rRNA processing protein [Dunaliella salina]|uniref:Pre-rRNA processing protein n=1 Tax=Dunaliella salina TaxID=3046 RepID=A0ABQ7G5A1_DUNSA|nr:pre-rRNA processing protein [Dunaliella salina]|eukprot:KAF5829785.1 pre-rRNA processing protein [Dunaliella salina]